MDEKVLKEYELRLDRVKHEHDLINHRIQWMLTFQGLLFTGLAIITNSSKPGNLTDTLLLLIPLLGFGNSILSLISIYSGYQEIDFLKETSEWKKYNDRKEDKIWGLKIKLGRSVGLGTAFLLLTAWSILTIKLVAS